MTFRTPHRKPFGLTRHESFVLLDTLQCDLTNMKDVLNDPGFTERQQQVHKKYCADLRKLIRRLRTFRT